MANLPEPCCGHAAVGKRAKTDRHIHTFLNQMDIPIGQHEMDVDLRITGQEIRHHRQHVQPPKNYGRCYGKISPRRAVLACSCSFSLSHLFQDSLRNTDIRSTSVRQYQFASRADQQPGAEMRFQISDLPAHSWERDVHLAPNGGQTTAVNPLDEHRHGFQPVAAAFPKSRVLLLNLAHYSEPSKRLNTTAQ